MASPQKENGYTPISNDIMEALAKIRIPGEARQILDVILRKTYGWRKKMDTISLGQFAELTGLSRRNAYRAIQKLKAINIISVVKSDNSYSVSYGFQKNFEKWKTVVKKDTVVKMDNKLLSKATSKVLSKKTPTKERKQIKQREVIFLPNWLDKKTWQEFKNHRISLKRKMTPEAEKRVLSKLTKLKEEGNDPSNVLGQSIENGWIGIFEERDNGKNEKPAWL